MKMNSNGTRVAHTHVIRWGVSVLVVAISLAPAWSVAATFDSTDVNLIQTQTGIRPTLDSASGVLRIMQPRNDVEVQVDSLQLPPFMGLTSWVAFKPGDSVPMVMGDLTLFEDEVNPVMKACLESGLEVSALHNHFLFSDPDVFFMHIGGEAALKDLATGVGRALETIRSIRNQAPKPATAFAHARLTATHSTITAKPLEDILQVKGQSKDGMFKVVIGKTTKMPCGCKVGAAMGVTSWAAFAGTDDRALVDGDVAMLEKEVQATLKILVEGGINVVALHNHMIGETPRLMFVHYWGIGPAANLAKTLRAALDQQS